MDTQNVKSPYWNALSTLVYGTFKLNKSHAQQNMNNKKDKNLDMFHAGFHDVHDAAETIGEEDRAHLR